MTTLILIFGLGVCLLGWHRSHEQLRHQKRDRRVLIAQNERLIELHRQKDAAINPRLRVVDRESHSHATSNYQEDSA